MLNHSYTFGINPRGTALVMRPVDTSSSEQDWSPEANLDALARRGNASCCRGFGQATLGLLGIWHSQLRDAHRPLFDPYPSAEKVFGAGANDDPAVKPITPTDHTGKMMPGSVTVGIADNRSALEFISATDGAVGKPRYLLFTELLSLGREGAADTVGDRILIGLRALHPGVVDRFPTLYQPT